MNTPSDDLSGRKTRHIEICVDEENYDPESGDPLFDAVHLRHLSMPEIDWDEIKLETEFLGRKIRLPLFISSMTGGSDESYRINKDLATAAQEAKVPVGMGSIRILLHKPEVLEHFELRKLARDVPIFSNIGAQQLIEERFKDDFRSLEEMNKRLEVDAIAVHLNPAQELFQKDGERSFRGVKDIIEDYLEKAKLPVIVKETGFGIAPEEVDFLLRAGAAYVDVAGSGGTNWLAVEAYRLDEEGLSAGEPFRDWGWPTALLLAAVGYRKGRILASGGLRDGLDLAKSLALGAIAGGFALPFIRAVKNHGVEGVLSLIRSLEKTLRTAMMLTGSRTSADLRKAPRDLTRDFAQSLKNLKKS